MARVALVTGGSRGIGAAISVALKAAGYTVAANYAGNEEAANAFTAETGIPTYKWSVAEYDACAAGIKQVEADLGPVDVLVNNAGITHRSSFAETELAVFQRVMAVNYFGALHCTQAALPSLLARGGQIIVLSSLSGFSPLLYRSAYNASKHALHGLFETLRYELKDSGVSVMLVCPGFTATDLRKNALVGDGSVAPQPPLAMGKVASPQDVAEAIYLAALKRKRLLILSNVDWRARILARFFPRLFERVLLPRLSGMKPQRTRRT
ncbi:MAG: SDR family oxidoreductase [Pseudotabrizicola sp.]|uniref:SDR family oxidoreductase n=1 Tax=Pseudotabrizicola sp. TaxID=2939647 RepID=UPI002727F212|nr:SDR family oxidoreductase [Pseudotabrizicola sp.]MDO9638185.1 SDR family oxidoreductase [Pseudotabrizicola sp.]